LLACISDEQFLLALWFANLFLQKPIFHLSNQVFVAWLLIGFHQAFRKIFKQVEKPKPASANVKEAAYAFWRPVEFDDQG
jgi:hypothetical protein